MRRSPRRLAVLWFVTMSLPLLAAEIHVSPNGDDRASGGADAPLRSITAAQQAARRLKSEQPGSAVTVWVHGGTWRLAEPLVFTAEDSGSAEAPTTYAAVPTETVVLSGGVQLTPMWKPWRDGILVTEVPAGVELETLYADGQLQHLARYPNFDPTVLPLQGFAADCLSPERVARWKDPTGGFVHALHSSMWGDYHWRITGRKPDGTVALEGGWQNNRQMGMHDKFRYVEGIFEELDAPGEWFLDRKAHRLYWLPPAGLDATKAVLEAPQLRSLVEVAGTAQAPVRHLTLHGFTVRHTARTFMDNREPLLRSDWTIYRGGAIHLKGAQDVTIERCTIDQVGGNAVFVDGWNRGVAVRSCEITGVGSNGVAFVGEAKAVRSPLFEYWQRRELKDLDQTPGPATEDYPADCLVDDCLIHAIAQEEKQSAPVQIAMAYRITVRDSSIYNVPRAGINIGDGCWGGHLIEGCDIFDTVRETGDHGSYNSWGRDRYWVPDIAEGTARVKALPGLELLDCGEPITLRRNRWRCDHGWDVDLDDGSSNYVIEQNLFLNGGLKLREGWHREVRGNVMVNNTVHPHVWHQGCGDIVEGNILFATYNPAGMHAAPWGLSMDRNLLHTPGSATAPATELATQSGRDAASLTGDARFRDPARGDYSVLPGSPALALGFRNFPMDRFGVRSPHLRLLARTPALPDGPTGSSAFVSSRDGTPMPWNGATVKNVTGLGEVSATGLPGERGVLVTVVEANSVAASLGLRPMDALIAVDDAPVSTVDDLVHLVEGATSPSVRLTVWRNQRPMTVVLNRR